MKFAAACIFSLIASASAFAPAQTSNVSIHDVIDTAFFLSSQILPVNSKSVITAAAGVRDTAAM
jgi:hypothetical protein